MSNTPKIRGSKKKPQTSSGLTQSFSSVEDLRAAIRVRVSGNGVPGKSFGVPTAPFQWGPPGICKGEK